MPIETEELDRRFRHHPPKTPEDVELHENIRSTLFAVASVINTEVPDGREKSVVITKLEEAMFWANAAIARGRAS